MIEKTEKLAEINSPPMVSKYYEGVATAFRYAKFITLIIAVVFIIVIMSLFRDEVSVENFQYMLKYITSEDSNLITTKKIHYPTSDSKALDLFNGDFVSAGTGGISLYNTNGSTVLKIDDTYLSPQFSLGRKYGLCYDLGGKSYVIFSTFTKLYSETIEYPISGAVMTDKGNYAVLTCNRDYKTVINLYSSDYTLTSRVYKDKYTFAFDVSPKYLAYASVGASDSRYLTELSVVKINSENEMLSAPFYDEFPVAVKFASNKLVFLTDKALRIYSSDFELISELNLSSSSYSGYAFSDNYIMLCFGKNIIGSENEVRFYSLDGSLLYTQSMSGKINYICAGESCALILANNSVTRLDFQNARADVCSVATGASKALLQSDMTALVCYSNHAQLVDFKETDESFLINIPEA